MAKSMMAVVLLVVNLMQLSQADDFLKSRVAQVDKEDVKQFLLSELSGRTDTARLRAIEAELGPLFASLPKNDLGRLDAAPVRYALHRYFVQKNGWHVKGLDSSWSHEESSSPSTVLKARAPAYIQSLFEEHLHGQGFGLHELTVFVATLADLIHAEALGQLENIYMAMGLSTTGDVSKKSADSAIEFFLIAYLLDMSIAESSSDLEVMKKRLVEQYPDYPETEMWMQDFQLTYDLARQPHRNPFVNRAPTFDDSAAFVVDLSHHFGAFQNLECHSLKRLLTDMEYMGTGRVRLADFYSNALGGGWQFMESIQYLRNQGALDETDPKRPSVVIPNYLNSLANCLTASNFYAVCCVNECNALMSHLERKIESPDASPARIIEIVSNLQSDSVDAPRNLSSSLIARLDEIAAYHGGVVPLHGRLFAQWMHHVYPRECQFPHIIGTVSPLTPQQFADVQGFEALQATHEEMTAHAAWKNETTIVQDLAWDHVEEELVVNVRKPKGRRFNYLSTLAAFGALASFALPLIRSLRSAGESKHESHLV